MATSPIYNWPEPDNTDLVKNGALAIRTLGNAIDTTMATMVPKSIVDAKGDLIAGTAADTAARLAVGNNGETLVADSSTSTGLRYQANFAAGKNAVINGAFDFWQRGTSFNNPSGTYCADRFQFAVSGGSGTPTVTQQTFTPGTAPVSGYEGTYFARINTATSATYFDVTQKIENVRTFAGQTVTFSFWAKASATTSSGIIVRQNFGSGGSANVDNIIYPNLTTSWQRFTMTVNPLGSMTGKTIGANSYLLVGFFANGTPPSGVTIDTWGWQMEASNVATAFQTATGTLQGELAACQRYYQQVVNGTTQNIGVGWNYSSSYAISMLYLPVVMRTAPTIAVTSGTNYYAFERNGGLDYVNAFFGAANTNPNNAITLRNSTEISGTAGQAGLFFSDNASANISLSAEL